MVDLFVIKDNPSSLEELELDKEKFDFMTYRQRKLSNDRSIEMYGKDNLTRYDIMRSDFLKEINPNNASDADRIKPVDVQDDSISTDLIESSRINGIDPELTDDKGYWLYILDKVRKVEGSGVPIMVLSDRNKTIDEYNDDDIVDLYDKFNQFNAMSKNLRLMANQTAVSIFGTDNYNLFNIIRYYNAYKDDNYDDGVNSFDASGYRQLIRQESNIVDNLIRKIDLDYNRSNPMSVMEQYECNWILNESDTPIDDMPMVPFFTPDEMEDFGLGGSASGEINLYGGEHDNETMDDREPVLDWFLKYKNSHGYMEDTDIWKSTLDRLYKDYNDIKESGDIIKINKRKRSILELGWNPEIDFNDNTLRLAKHRLKPYMEYYKIYDIDISKYCNDIVSESITSDIPKFDDDTYMPNDMTEMLRPIYLVLVYRNDLFNNMIKGVLKSEFSHISMGFKSDLSTLYTFGIRRDITNKQKLENGMIVENIDSYKQYKDCKIKILTLFVTKGQYLRIVSAVRWFESHKDQTKYAVGNLINILLGRKLPYDIRMKMVCSQFVDAMLRIGNSNLIKDKTNNTITPKDFELARDQKMYTIFKGSPNDFDKNKLRKATYGLMSKADPKLYLAFWKKDPIPSMESAVEHLFEINDILELKSMDINSTYYTELVDLLTPTSFIREKCFDYNITESNLLRLKYDDILQELNQINESADTVKIEMVDGVIEKLKCLKSLSKIKSNNTFLFNRYNRLIGSINESISKYKKLY